MSNYLIFTLWMLECLLSITPFSYRQIQRYKPFNQFTIICMNFVIKCRWRKISWFAISVTDFYWFVNNKQKERKQITLLVIRGLETIFTGAICICLGLIRCFRLPRHLDNNEQKMTTEIKWCTKLHFQFRFKRWTSKKVCFTRLGLQPSCALWGIICILQLFAIRFKCLMFMLRIIFVS